MTHSKYIAKILIIRARFDSESRLNFDDEFVNNSRDPSKISALGLLGGFGLDRFANGQLFLGFLKLITGGGAFIWTLWDMGHLEDKVIKNNINFANRLLTIEINSKNVTPDSPKESKFDSNSGNENNIQKSSDSFDPEKLSKLFDLLNSGAITQEEYDKEKSRLFS